LPQCSLGPLPPRRRVLDGPSRRHFYLRNLCLNLNLALPALLLAPLLLLAGRLVPAAAGEPPPRPGRAAVLLSGGYLWLAFYSAIPHKEERFLFPAYPLFLLAAALAASEARRVAAALLARCAPRRAQRGREGGPHGVWPPLWGLPAAALAASALLSAGRVGALVSYYGAPLEVYSEVSAALSSRADDSPLRVCSGKEWYRYPSSFFLPPGATPAFYRAGFDGLLPSPFSAPPPDGSRAIHAHFNDGNRDEPAAYTSEDRCDVIVDLELPGDAAPRSRAGWHVWARRPFLDADRSPSWSRALYVPWLTAGRNVYANYSVLGRQPLMVMLHGSV